MKRPLLVCIPLGALALAATAYGAYAYREAGALSAQVEMAEKKLSEAEARVQASESRLAELMEKERQLEAARKAFAAGSVLKDMESAVTAAPNAGADQMLAAVPGTHWNRSLLEAFYKAAKSDAEGRAEETARAKAKALTAAAALPKGVFITTTPRAVAASTSTLSTPIPARPTTLSLEAAANTSAVTLVLERTASPS